MKSFIANIWEIQRSKVDLAIIAMFFAAVVLGCGGSSKPDAAKKTIPAEYLGNWIGQDGTTLAIRGNDSGDYNAGSSKVNGATVEVDEAGKTIKFTMLGVNVGKYTIDSAPAGNQMKLSGTIFKRSGGFDAAPTDSTNNRVPSEGELQSLVKQTMMDFGQAVDAGDFTIFYDKLSKAAREHTTPQKLNTDFKSFIDKKLDTRIVKDIKAGFSPAPEIDNNGTLKVVGDYPTKPPTNFELDYLNENGEWKLTFFKFKVK